MKKQTQKTFTFNQLFNFKTCAGWAVELEEAQNKYIYHNSNDLGLISELANIPQEQADKFTLIEKIKIAKQFFIYILKPTTKGVYTFENMLKAGEEIENKENLTRTIKKCWKLERITNDLDF